MRKLSADSASRHLKRAAGAVVPHLPAPIRQRLFPSHLSWNRQDLSILPLVGDAPTRLLIAPANYAGQGHFWSQAVNTIPGVSAANLQYKSASRITFPADASISKAMSSQSLRWSRQASEYILKTFTHILIEAEQPFLGAVFGRDIYREIEAMLEAGITVGFVSHGSDLRTPALHRQLNPASPFNGPLEGLTEQLETSTERNHRLVSHFELPLFVPTPDLLPYCKGATWLPLTVDIPAWNALPRHSWPTKPRFLHVPSQPALKGTAVFRDVLRPLEREGRLEYRELSGLTPAEVRNEIAAADVVLDQLTMGLYSTTALEAMAAGKLVVAQVSEATRERITQLTGMVCPIIEATPSTLDSVITKLIEQPELFDSVRDASERYVREVHGPQAIVTALSGFLNLPSAS